jgi:hypothetical protein
MSESRKGKPVILRLDALATSTQRDWLRTAGVATPRFREHAELLVQEIQQTWETQPASPLQQRFLRLRGRWRDGLNQHQAFYLVNVIADHERDQELQGERLPSWERLTELEPRLQDILEHAGRRPSGLPVFCRHQAWYGRDGIKVRFARLVGLGAEQPGLLTTAAAYQVAYQKIFSVIPECDANCPCQAE